MPEVADMSMRAAFSAWGSRIAPVFEVAQEALVVDAAAHRVLREVQEPMPADLPAQAALRLAELQVGTLVCGAISRPTVAAIEAYGIEVRSFRAGEVREVVEAWLAGTLDRSAFCMPGCGCRCRGRRR
jgi:predicted Fe-Mo cluster-binding NifX family protein